MQSDAQQDAARESLIGLFALHMMERGSVYGSDVANKIKELTEGTWKPGAGAIYPTLNRLVRKGYARIDLSDERKRYHLTQKGKTFVEEVKMRFLSKSKYTFTWRLVLEMIDRKERAEFVIERFKSGLETVTEILNERDYLPPEERRHLAKAVIEDMQRTITKISQAMEAM